MAPLVASFLLRSDCELAHDILGVRVFVYLGVLRIRCGT